MNREVKFKAYVKEIGSIYDVYELYSDGGVMVVGYDFPLGADDINLMQYTGLKDKNGKEIYEGDICKCNYFNSSKVKQHIEVVEFKAGQFDLTWTINKLFKSFRSRSHFNGHPDAFEVIGNIYENPELLKSVKNG